MLSDILGNTWLFGGLPNSSYSAQQAAANADLQAQYAAAVSAANQQAYMQQTMNAATSQAHPDSGLTIDGTCEDVTYVPLLPAP